MRGKYLLSFVEEAIFDSKYFGWAGGRMEVRTYDRQHAVDEVRFFTRRNYEWNKFREEYELKWVDKSTLDKITKIIKEKFYTVDKD